MQLQADDEPECRFAGEQLQAVALDFASRLRQRGSWVGDVRRQAATLHFTNKNYVIPQDYVV